MCQVWVGHNLGPIQNMELDFWMNKIQDTKSKSITTQSVYVVQYVLLCPSYLFSYILTAKFIKTGKKNKQTKNQ